MKAPAKSTASALDEEYLERRFRMRGVEFVIREIDITRYDELVVQCTATKVNADGDDEEVVDQTMLLKLMTRESLVSPDKLPKGTRIMRQLQAEVRDLHFGLEPVESPKSDGSYESDKNGDGNGDDESDEDDDPNESAG